MDKKLNMGTLRKEIINNELYLYNAKNELIYKRWIQHNYSIVFDIMPYGKDTLVSITDKGIEKNK